VKLLDNKKLYHRALADSVKRIFSLLQHRIPVAALTFLDMGKFRRQTTEPRPVALHLFYHQRSMTKLLDTVADSLVLMLGYR
jgi:hypothetical protein